MKVKKLVSYVNGPTTQDGDAGYDFYSTENVLIPAGATASIHLGVAVEFPHGFVLELKDRSSMGIRGLHLFAGVVDSTYRGELKCVMFNSTSHPVTIFKGEKVCQGVLKEILKTPIEFVDELTDTERGSKGFGSTGR